MTFGEKVQKLRKEKKLSQTEFGNQVGVALRTVRSWEVEGKYPRYRHIYTKIAEVLECEIDYLLTEQESFVTEASERYGSRGAAEARNILDQATAIFAGGELSDDERLAFMTEIQQLYLDSKNRAKKFTPKKYLDDEQK